MDSDKLSENLRLAPGAPASALRRRLLLRTGALALPALGSAVRAQAAWPSRSLRLVVPFPPGGTTDAVSRLVATELGRSLGQTVVVENRPGGGTVIGVETVARAAPDGHTLVCVANSFAVNHTLVRKLPYDSLRDLVPVALMGASDHVLALHPAVKARNLRELAELSRREKLSYGSFGNGTSAHLAGEMLRALGQVSAVHVPYKGQAPALNDLLGGQITMMFGNWPEFAQHVHAGRLRALGMATRQRIALAPEVPTLAEQGAAIESNSWNGLLAPAGTPAAVVQRLNAEVNQALAAPAVREAFRLNGISSLATTPALFASFIQSEIARYARVITEAGITLEG